MCTTCGCSGGLTTLTKVSQSVEKIEEVDQSESAGEGNTDQGAYHSHHGHHPHDHHHHSHGQQHHSHSHEHIELPEEEKRLELEVSLLSKNDKIAEQNRKLWVQNNIFAINLLSSPGSGKTTLLESTLIKLLQMQTHLEEEDQTSIPIISLGVIEGDQTSLNDAERIQACGVNAIQVNTGKGCHLEAEMIARGLQKLDQKPNGITFIENVGNLVCPAMFDLGESKRATLISVTEGEDKPLKYPYMFASTDLVVITKVDLLPHLDFDLELLKSNIHSINPSVEIIETSVTSLESEDQTKDWLNWLLKNVKKVSNHDAAPA